MRMLVQGWAGGISSTAATTHASLYMLCAAVFAMSKYVKSLSCVSKFTRHCGWQAFLVTFHELFLQLYDPLAPETSFHSRISLIWSICEIGRRAFILSYVWIMTSCVLQISQFQWKTTNNLLICWFIKIFKCLYFDELSKAQTIFEAKV